VDEAVAVRDADDVDEPEDVCELEPVPVEVPVEEPEEEEVVVRVRVLVPLEDAVVEAEEVAGGG
jgi:hypothetical protein